MTPRKLVEKFIERNPYPSVYFCAEELCIKFPNQFNWITANNYIRKVIDKVKYDEDDY